MNLRKLFLIVFFAINIPLAIISFTEYQGQPFYYILFTIVSFFFVVYLTNNHSTFLDNFISVFFFMGYWFNFSLKLSLYKSNYKDYSDGIGSFNFESKSYDEVLLVCIISFISVMIASFIRRIFIFKNYFYNFDIIIKKNNKEIKYSIIFFITIILFSFFNLDFGFYQRGMNYLGETNLVFLNLIKWLLIMGIMAFFSHMIFYFLQENHFPNYLIITTIISKFLLSLSILSRAMIFDVSSILWALFKFERNKARLLYLFSFSIFALILFFLSIPYVDKTRVMFFSKEFNNNAAFKNNNIEDAQNKLLKFYEVRLVSRLHGLEALMAVVGVENKNKKLLLDALKEKPSDATFFDKLKSDYRGQSNNSKISSLTLPGIIAFLYYSGSFSILFFSLFTIIIFFSVFEKAVYKITNGNFILASFFSQIIAFRLWHFGYVPINSYKLISGIMIFILIIFLFNKTSDFFKNL